MSENIDTLELEVDKISYWAVGVSLGKTSDHSKEFLKNKIWQDGWASMNDERNKDILSQIKKGDYLLMKSSSKKGIGNTLAITKLKGIGRITGKANYYTFFVNWLENPALPKNFENILYSNPVEMMREDWLLDYAKSFIKRSD